MSSLPSRCPRTPAHRRLGGSGSGAEPHVFPGPPSAWLWNRSHSLVSPGLDLWGSSTDFFVLSSSESEAVYAVSEKWRQISRHGS